MRKRFLPFLLTLLLTGCFGIGQRSGQESTFSSSSINQSVFVPQDITYVGHPVEVMAYDSTFEIAPNLRFDGEIDPDAEVTYRTEDTDVISVDEHGVVTAFPYNPYSGLGNTNELVNVTVIGKRGGWTSVRLAVTLLTEDADFHTIYRGEGYRFFTSTGIIENLKCYEDGYAECSLYEESTGDRIHTTITPSYGVIGLESTIVTSHFKTVIKRDEKGGAKMANIPVGSKIKFLTMVDRSEEFGFSRTFNSIVMEVLGWDDTVCSITNHSSSLTLSKTEGHFGETFTVTAPKDIYVNVRSRGGMVFYISREVEGETAVCTFRIVSRAMDVHTDANLTNTEHRCVGEYIPNTMRLGPYSTNEEYSEALFGEDSNLYQVQWASGIRIVPSGIFRLGATGTNYAGALTITLPQSKRITCVRVLFLPTNVGNPITVSIAANYFNQGGTTLFDTTYPANSTNGLSDLSAGMPLNTLGSITLAEFTIYICPRFHNETNAITIRKISFYTIEDIAYD